MLNFMVGLEKKRFIKFLILLLLQHLLIIFYVALEAKNYGIPVVSCSKGDIKKIVINNVDGYLNQTNSTKKWLI